MSDDQEFFITILSNSCSELFSENKTSNFKVSLSKEINLNASHRVALSEVIYQNTINNVTDHNNVISIIQKNKIIDLNQKETHFPRNFRIIISPQNFQTVEKLVIYINKKFFDMFAINLFAEKLNNENLIQIAPSIDNLNDAISSIAFEGFNVEIQKHKSEIFQYNQQLIINLQGRLALMLGFEPDSNILLKNGENSVPNLCFGIPPEMIIYASFIDHQFISNMSAQVLRIIKTVDSNNSYGDVVSRSFTNLNYLKLNTHRLKEVSFEIRDSSGELINFAFGTFILTLHIKKIDNNESNS